MIGHSETWISFRLKLIQQIIIPYLEYLVFGTISAKRIIRARRSFNLKYDELKKLGVVLKRAKYFITCNGKYYEHVKYFRESFITENLMYIERKNYSLPTNSIQMSLFDLLPPSKEDKVKCLTGNI